MKIIKKFFKNINNIIKELKKTPRGKAILFFSFYFIFFIFVFITLGAFSSNDSYEDNNDSTLKFDVSSLEKSNYNFTYDITLNGVNYLYEGISDGDESIFTYNLDSYYHGDFFMKKVDDTYVLVNDFDYIYSNIISSDKLVEIFNNSTYVSKTEYESGRVDYSYIISTTTLASVSDGSVIDIEDVGNNIKISMDADNNIINVVLDISSYSNYLGYGDCVINLSYNNFLNIEEIDI